MRTYRIVLCQKDGRNYRGTHLIATTDFDEACKVAKHLAAKHTPERSGEVVVDAIIGVDNVDVYKKVPEGHEVEKEQ